MKIDRKSAVISASVVGVLLSVTACSSPGSPVPGPTSKLSTPHSTGVSEQPSSSRPNPNTNISDPISVHKYLEHSCEVLTDQQVSSLGGSPGSANLDAVNHGSPSSSSCSWKSKSHVSSRMSIYLSTKYERGLTDFLKGQKKKHVMADFEKADAVEGYPAYIANPSKTDRSNGTCQLAVGLNRSVIMFAGVAFSPSGDPCRGARRVAETAIQTMKSSS